MTGILDRLERGNWVVRERDRWRPAAGRSPLSCARRNAELFRLYSEMDTLLDQICSECTESELELLAGFLRHTTTAGRDSTDELAGD